MKPDNFLPSQIIVSKGAKIIEEHVGIENDKIKLNSYSSSPEQVDKWIKSCLYAKRFVDYKIIGVYHTLK